VVRRRAGPERDVWSNHADERAPAHTRELPEVLIGPRSGRERITIGLDAAPADDHDGVRTELRDGVVLGRFAERDESEVHALRPGDPKIGTFRAPRLLAGGTPELVLGFDPAPAAAEEVGPAVLPIGHQRLTADHNMLERSHRRKLSVHGLAFSEERQIKTRFHAEEA
jgi:hypothetical protein